MDFDTAYIEPLLDGWLEDLQTRIKEQENCINVKDEYYMPFIAIPVPVVSAILKITEYLELGPETKYVAIHLYDKFMCNYFWKLYKTTNQTEDHWSEVCKKISSQAKLYLMSCLQLASKLDSHSNNLGISQVLNVLKWIDGKTEYTRGMIFSSEYEVFKMVEFKMPLCTPLNCVDVLLAAIGLKNTQNLQNLVISLLDLVYLQWEMLYSQQQYLVYGHVATTHQEKRNCMTLKCNVLFLAASVILCATFFSCIDNEAAKIIASKLSEFVNINPNDIWKMANILFMMAVQE
ncbi:cyclin N-terminal domain-containing protein 1 [Osmia lignaria lignaria]|uniref:cyclin N-terminal domain-containing protein 1 n=1 Tax=Osmia lignaria lignaria TaxID=1437193 RepID=UPI001478E098|nr:uncharacterized protein LOC117608809 isoform X1 [Osmia lignaria]